jgi:imidazoleglycerol-phosphate dehydratase
VAKKEIKIERKTKETDIVLSLNMRTEDAISFAVGIPFLEHLLTAMAFHGGFSLDVKASGDIHIDPHHLVEDIGITFGDALCRLSREEGSVARYGHAVIPMDESLSEVTIDACGRAYLQFTADFPQKYPGGFDVSLVREFLQAMTNNAQINLHANCRYGMNSHHMVESLFKALGIAVKQAYSPAVAGVRSTKGVL